ncbi:helix-turn-helix domain-containing protein [Streptomyces sp. NPDC087866]|uniref:helix-turn-helix domain-containing protein n=1 Tax=Streptomyces sp. NPDC087866 TaxID=3365815 RepID=UPI003821820E
MDATTAARKSKVTVATIRDWCRTGVIAATKSAGRWHIDAQSLRAHRRRIRAIRDARQNRNAARTHAGIAAHLTLPTLTGTPKQVAWATDIRNRSIDAALTLVTHDFESGTPGGPLTYELATGYTALDHDPLNAYQVLGKNAYTRHATESSYVAAFNRVLAARTSASAWINPNR